MVPTRIEGTCLVQELGMDLRVASFEDLTTSLSLSLSLSLSSSSSSSFYFQFLYLLVTSVLLQRTFQRNRFNTKEVRLPDGPRHSSSSYNFTTQRAKKQEVPSRFHPIPIKPPQNDVPMSWKLAAHPGFLTDPRMLSSAAGSTTPKLSTSCALRTIRFPSLPISGTRSIYVPSLATATKKRLSVFLRSRLLTRSSTRT